METVRVSVSFYVTGQIDLDVHLDEVMTSLRALESADDRLTDSDYDAVLSTGLVRFNISAQAETFDDATAIAMAAIRSAIHAAGGFTPGWESSDYVVTGSETAEYNFVEQQLIKW